MKREAIKKVNSHSYTNDGLTGCQAKELQFEEQIPKTLIHELSIIRQKVNTIEGELDSVKCYLLRTRNVKAKLRQ